MGEEQLLSFSNPVLSNYAFYGSIVLSKMMLMSALTAYKRITRKVFVNPEDTGLVGLKPDKITLNDPVVERVRRNHLNDIENIPAFLFLGLLYVLTGPSHQVAVWHFRVFAASRILHTVSYQAGIQPYRALSFFAGVGVCASMAVQILCKAKF